MFQTTSQLCLFGHAPQLHNCTVRESFGEADRQFDVGVRNFGPVL
jgi:hypothetical protein